MGSTAEVAWEGVKEGGMGGVERRESLAQIPLACRATEAGFHTIN